MDRIESHSEALANYLIGGLNGTGWCAYRKLEDKASSSHIVTLSHATGDSDATLQALLDANIICSIRNGRVRVSLAHYNDEGDVNAIIDVLKQVVIR